MDVPSPARRPVTLVDHPLVQHKLSLLRDRTTSTASFRAITREISLLLAYEVTRVLPLEFVEICGWALARAHARTGDPARIAGYLGKHEAFDRAIGAFAVAYADQTERDYGELVKAIRAGKLQARADVAV